MRAKEYFILVHTHICYQHIQHLEFSLWLPEHSCIVSYIYHRSFVHIHPKNRVWDELHTFDWNAFNFFSFFFDENTLEHTQIRTKTHFVQIYVCACVSLCKRKEMKGTSEKKTTRNEEENKFSFLRLGSHQDSPHAHTHIAYSNIRIERKKTPQPLTNWKLCTPIERTKCVSLSFKWLCMCVCVWIISPVYIQWTVNCILIARVVCA